MCSRAQGVCRPWATKRVTVRRMASSSWSGRPPCARHSSTLLVALAVIAGAPLSAAQSACTAGNTIIGGGTVAVFDYADEESCSWTLVCSSGAPTLSFETFDTEANFDFMYLYEGADAQGLVLEPGLSGSGDRKI